jgi:hypothetical protein
MLRAEELAYWINERYAMKLRKERGERKAFGYSDDSHMGSVRFCNVHREDDAVTQWLAQHWRPQHNTGWELALARMINYTPSLEMILANGLDKAGDTLKKMRAENFKIFTSAYTITTCGQRVDKIDYVMGVVHSVKGQQWRLDNVRWLWEAWEILMSVKGLGSFLSAQIVADMKNTRGNPLDNVHHSVPDWWLWAAPGPGSLKGLSELFGRSVTVKHFDPLIRDGWYQVHPLLNADIPPIHMQDFQNCLCEFSKFMRVKRGGHVRNRYSAG